MKKSTKIKRSFFSRMRTYFFAGILILAPIAITFYLTYAFVTSVDANVNSLIPAQYNPNSYLPFSIPGLGLVISVVFITLVGALTAGFFGRLFVNLYEKILNRMPVVRSIYSSLKQILETVLSSQSNAFRQVVLVEYPRKKIWVLGFVTGHTKGEVQEKVKETLVSVFVPTTPNPTSGFLIFLPESEISPLEMNVEDAFKMLISSGIVVPEETAKKLPRKKLPRKKQTKKKRR